MKLSVFSVLLSDQPLEQALAFLKSQGVQAVEIGCGGYPGKAHCDPAPLLADEAKLAAFKAAIDGSGLELAALSVHGNAVHPDQAVAKSYHDDFVNAVLLAEKLGIDRIVTFSGCPGGSAEDKTPNWVTCSWPEDYTAILDYQWNRVLIPYWKEASAFALSHGVKRIAFEMHPGFCVYNPSTLLRLREAVGGDILGANVDPSHLFWQGINPVEAIKYLKGAIHYFHAKDTHLDAHNIAVNGVLDIRHYSDPMRSWVFRTVGYGHDALHWKEIFSTLRSVGYDDVISIEHEDALMSSKEGLTKAIRFLQDTMIFEQPGEMYWA